VNILKVFFYPMVGVLGGLIWGVGNSFNHIAAKAALLCRRTGSGCDAGRASGVYLSGIGIQGDEGGTDCWALCCGCFSRIGWIISQEIVSVESVVGLLEGSHLSLSKGE